MVCFWCTVRPGADLLLNWGLFLPGGAVLRVLFGPRKAVGLGLLATIAVETAQLFIEGRNPALADIVLNGAGVATGAWMWAPARLRWAYPLGAVCAAAAWLLPAGLLEPSPTDATLYAVWTPAFSGMARYDGAVLRAEVGGIPTRYRVDRSEAVAEALGRGDPIRVTFVAGAPTPGLAPLYGLYDEERTENLLVGVLGHDLLVRTRSRAARLGLDRPDVRWPDALASVAGGDTVRLSVDRGPDSTCLRLDGRERCDVAPTAADGYAFLLNLEGAAASLRRTLAGAWILVIGALLGAPFRRSVHGVTLALLVGGAGWALAAGSPALDPSPASLLLLPLGAALAARSALPGQDRHGQDPPASPDDPPA
ncbi:MAG: VanZ family protein [Longimicrobiales bacterium]